MVVLSDWERLEPSLPDMAARLIMLVITTNVRGHEPHHEVAEVTIVERPNRQVKMVGHETIAQQTDGSPFFRLLQKFEERVEVPRLVEDGVTGIAAIQHVIAIAASRRACSAWHIEKLFPVSKPFASIIYDVPFSFLKEQSDDKKGGIVTLYALDPEAHSFSFTKARYGNVMKDYTTYANGGEIEYGCYQKDSFRVGFSGPQKGKIVDLGTADDLQKKYGYSETVGNGQGFASIHMKNNKILIRKASENAGRGGTGSTGGTVPAVEYNENDFQPVKETEELFEVEEKKPRPPFLKDPVKLGHIYVLRITEKCKKDFELVVKLKVISHKPDESVTIRWQILE
jgi:hypothetical protein